MDCVRTMLPWRCHGLYLYQPGGLVQVAYVLEEIWIVFSAVVYLQSAKIEMRLYNPQAVWRPYARGIFLMYHFGVIYRSSLNEDICILI